MKSILRTASLATASVLAGVGLAVVAAPAAFADGSTPTSVAVTANQTSVATGKPVSFNALVTPSKVGSVKITGTVTWTITGHDGSVVPCTKQSLLSHGGKSRCTVAKGALLGGATAYTAVASYSGDSTFGASSGSTSLAVTIAPTRVKIAVDATPSDGAATTATATVVGGPASSLLSGNVVFTVSSGTHAAGVVVACTGPSSNPKDPSNNVKAVTGGVAVCSLPAGWMVIPKASNFNPKPYDNWSISAVYNGNASFSTSFRTIKGTAK